MLIRGESGTGRAGGAGDHEGSPRRAGPFVALHCGAPRQPSQAGSSGTSAGPSPGPTCRSRAASAGPTGHRSSSTGGRRHAGDAGEAPAGAQEDGRNLGGAAAEDRRCASWPRRTATWRSSSRRAPSTGGPLPPAQRRARLDAAAAPRPADNRAARPPPRGARRGQRAAHAALAPTRWRAQATRGGQRPPKPELHRAPRGARANCPDHRRRTIAREGSPRGRALRSARVGSQA